MIFWFNITCFEKVKVTHRSNIHMRFLYLLFLFTDITDCVCLTI